MKKHSSKAKKTSPKKSKPKKKSTSKMAPQLVLDSSSESIHIVEKLIDTICASYRVNEDHYGNILVAITEAVNNAIYHGNQSDPGKKIHIAFKSDPNRMTFCVRDEGKGFDFKHLPDPTDPKNLEKPTGRGVFLMHRLADSVEFTEHGRCVSLEFALIAN
jgi:serine/threonine-protein kinase RsbW